MNVAEMIADKRDGRPLNERAIRFLIDGYAQGRIEDYQLAAFAMAVYFRGMSSEETRWLTDAMLRSGEVLKWNDNGRPKVDKHSTGGIGDKISIPLAPLLACLDMDVPMISGRGLGATGGTLDKLESIPGFRTDLSLTEMVEIVKRVGCVITGASEQIAPADRKLYALRDVTATVPSIPLITASILSKKLAEGLDALVLDVKFGSGAFMKTRQEAERLADSLVQVAGESNVATTALLTDMNRPLGKLIGNSVEVNESLEVLDGGGPADVRHLTLELAAELQATALGTGLDEARSRAATVLDSGAARERFERMVAEQGGRLDELVRRESTHELTANAEGIVQTFQAELIGWAVIELGGGRRELGDSINHAAGVETLVDVGDRIEIGQPLFNVFCDQGVSPRVESLLRQAVELGEEPASRVELIVDRMKPSTT